MASRSCQSSSGPCDSSSNDHEYFTPNNVAETTPGPSGRVACLVTAARLYLTLPPEEPMYGWHIDSNLKDHYSGQMASSSIIWIPDITDWWHQQEEMHYKYADLSNVVCDIFSIIPHGVGVEANFSLGGDVIGWRQSKTTGETLRKKCFVRQFGWPNNRMLAGADPELDTMNTEHDSKMKNEAETRKLHRMA